MKDANNILPCKNLEIKRLYILLKLLKFLKTEISKSIHQLIPQFKFYFSFCTFYFLLLKYQLIVQDGTLELSGNKTSFLHNREDRLTNERTPNTE